MVNAVTRQATHVISVVLPTLPVEMAAIHRVTLETGFIRERSRRFRKIDYVTSVFGFRTGFGVLVAVGVAEFTLGSA